MNNLILFVGNTDRSLNDVACSFNPQAKHITHDLIPNLNQIDVGYISIGDHHLGDFILALDTASEIHYVNSDDWELLTKLTTECYLRYFSYRKPVHNFIIDYSSNNPNGMLDLIDSRKTNDKQLWVAGDSFTVGTPWVNENETYRSILSQKLKLPVSILAKGGSSISWAADQILRSDIHKNDIVVFMLTSTHRFPYYTDKQIYHINDRSIELDPKLKTKFNKKVILDLNLVYQAITSIDRVIHDARKIGYNLVLTKSPLDSSENEFYMMNYLSYYNCFVHHYRTPDDPFLDYGTDGEHPGPNQHQFYADVIFDFINQNKFS